MTTEQSARSTLPLNSLADSIVLAAELLSASHAAIHRFNRQIDRRRLKFKSPIVISPPAEVPKSPLV